MNPALKSFQVVFLAFSLVVSLLLLSNVIPVNKAEPIGFGNGLRYGLDFAGGTQLQLKLAREVTPEVMDIEKKILENRLNSMGLREIPVNPWGSQYMIIQIAAATPQEAENIENILKQQARFEERIDGAVAIKGDEITVDLGPQGTEVYRLQGGYSWGVVVSHSKEGACRFGQVGDAKRGRPVDIFIDRPENTSILFSESDYEMLSNLTETGGNDRFFYDGTALDIITNRSAIPALRAGDETMLLAELYALRGEGYSKVILAADEGKISDALRNRLEEEGYRTERAPQGNMSHVDWIAGLVGLQSSPRLDFDPHGECVYEARITGSSPTLEEAIQEVQKNQVLLTSGNLPVELTVESKSTTPPALGRKFLSYSFYTGLVAILVVAVLMYVRYRRLGIVVPVMVTVASEIIIILGMASFIKWELDLAAMAGIIATIGTGVDHQIVITDESLKRTRQKKEVGVSERIRRAFFIIFTAAATVVAAMLPLFAIGAGMLKGFALTTIMGVFIGVLITRSAYAKMIEGILRKEE